jgi:hypothetical protein
MADGRRKRRCEMSEVDKGVRWNNYIVFKNGDCFSLARNKIIKKVTNRQGYHQYTLAINGKNRRIGVHRLMAIVYIPNPENKAVINHKDGVRTNNTLDNLEWFTQKENVRDGYDRMFRNEQIPHRAKLDKEKVLEIYKLINQGILTVEIARRFDVSLGAIRQINKRRTWGWLADKVGFKEVTLKKGRTTNEAFLAKIKEKDSHQFKADGKTLDT